MNYDSENFDNANTPSPPKPRKKIKVGVTIGSIIFAILLVLICANSVVETVEKGTYDIVQYPITGQIEAKMEPGMYYQGWGDVTTWPKSDTFFFTYDMSEGSFGDQSIEVRFNDGSKAKISGTCRVIMPTDPDRVKSIMTDLNYKSYKDLEQRLILPIVRNALRTTANLMNARQSYSEGRSDFQTWAWDQIENGRYKLADKYQRVKDTETGRLVTKKVKVIARDTDGIPLREKNVLKDIGISLNQFDIKKFIYDDKVKDQIAAQQENYMAIATAAAQAQRAEEEAKTAEAQGKKEVMKVKYEELRVKEKAVIQAEKEKEVAAINAQKLVDVALKKKEEATVQAQQLVEVAKLQKDAAKETKQKLILEGEGEAKKKKLLMEADGALAQKLEALVQIQLYWANAFAKRKVPATMFITGESGGTGDTDASTMRFVDIMTMNAAKQLSVDTKISGSNK